MKKKIIYLLTLVIITAIALFSYSNSQNKNIKSGNDIKIFIATDIHYLAKTLTEDSTEYKEFATPKDGKQLLYISEIMAAFTEDIKNENPDFLIISGDLTNNGEKESHLELVENFKLIEKMGTKVFVAPGNHDIKSIWARGFKDGKPYSVENIDQDDFKIIYENFGYNEAISKAESGLSYMVAPSDDLWLLIIDSNLYFKGQGIPTNRGTITDETMKWISSCSDLAEKNNAQIITVMHHNLLEHSEKMSNGNTIDNSEEAIKLFRELNLNIVLSGHIHTQNINTNEEGDNSITEIVTSSLAIYPQQYGVINFSKTDGFKYNTTMVKVDEWAEKESQKDDNLINFKVYSKSAFYNMPYARTYSHLKENGGYSESEIVQISDLVAKLSMAYFKGNVYTIKKDIENSYAYKLILETDCDFVYDFVYNIMMSGNKDNSSIYIPTK